MSRLIDANALKATIIVDGYEHFSGCLSSSEVSLLEMVKDDIDETPTVDAVPVVRCRGCIAYTPVDDNTGKCVFLNQYVVPDGYCYLGERKEGADNEP